MIVPRLVLGTARIAGGQDAVALVRSGLDAGICHIDTAPSYGMGTAETIVGRALAGFDHVGVTTKLGSARPALPWLRTLARQVKRALAAPAAPAPQLAPKRITEPSGNDFSRADMAQSLALSHDRLGRVDVLLLHDISLPEVTKAVVESLRALAESVTAAPGYAGYAQWDSGLDAAFPAGIIAQCAPDPAWLTGTVAAPTKRALWLHSIVKTGLAITANQPHFVAALDRATAMIAARDPLTARIAALYVLAAERVPGARLLITSSRRDRLDALLEAITAIDLAGQADEIAALFPAQVG